VRADPCDRPDSAGGVVLVSDHPATGLRRLLVLPGSALVVHQARRPSSAEPDLVRSTVRGRPGRFGDVLAATAPAGPEHGGALNAASAVTRRPAAGTGASAAVLKRDSRSARRTEAIR
jgi:hypothetical protein